MSNRFAPLRFQSTLPVRGATAGRPAGSPRRRISIHAPREGSDEEFEIHTYDKDISIHAPREGSDGNGVEYITFMLISIHAPREGSDFVTQPAGGRDKNFNPRSP